jgi:alpha-mannosidase
VFNIGLTLLRQIYPILGIAEIGIDAKSNPEKLIALNTLPWPRQEIIQISDDTSVLASGAGSLLSISPLHELEEDRPVTVRETSPGTFQLQNTQLTATITSGLLTSLYDRVVQREVLSGPANRFTLFDDKPIYWQAWDVEIYHLETRAELPSSVSSISENTHHRVSVSTTIQISDLSSIRSTISLSAALEGQQSYVECSAHVDWHETMKFLKVEFPVSVQNTEASYETQFGITKRPTHYNTS